MELIHKSLVLLFLQMVSLSTCSSTSTVFHNTSFSFPKFDSNNVQNITFEGDAFTSGGALQPTKNQHDGGINNSVGRARYKPLVWLWDKASGSLADFSTRFSMEINFDNVTSKGDGLAFFLASNGSALPDNSGGGNLGLLSATAGADPVSFVAVEFDTFFNEPLNDTGGDHVGIDVNSLQSKVKAQWNSNQTNGKRMDAWIRYDPGSRSLAVSVTDANGVSVLNSGDLSLTVDLSQYLTEWVVVGFSAGTGSKFEIHKIWSWSFESSLHVPANDTVRDGSPASEGLTPSQSPGSSEPKKGRENLWIVLGICGGVFVCASLTLGLILFLWCKKRKNPEVQEASNIQVLDEGIIDAVVGMRKFSYNELMMVTNNFAEEGVLGEGGSGKVYLGFLREKNNNVAVKRIAQQSQQGMKEYLSEVRTISRLTHKNLVQLLGWCHEEQQHLLLVYEFMPNGSLDLHLFNEPCSLTWTRRYRIAQDLASALLYLQEWCDPCILHRDIKLSNILLTLNFKAKLSDFGLARLVEHEKLSQTTDVLFGTEGYIAPEYADSKRASKKSDIYSLGVVVLQLACSKRAIGNVNGNRVKLVEWLWGAYGSGNILDAADSRLQGNYDEEQMERLMVVGLICAHPNHLERPSIKEVTDMLDFKAPLPSGLKAPRYYVMSPEANEGPNYFVDSVDASDSNRTRTHSSGAAS